MTGKPVYSYESRGRWLRFIERQLTFKELAPHPPVIKDFILAEFKDTGGNQAQKEITTEENGFHSFGGQVVAGDQFRSS
jgi:hypothetical protein